MLEDRIRNSKQKIPRNKHRLIGKKIYAVNIHSPISYAKGIDTYNRYNYLKSPIIYVGKKSKIQSFPLSLTLMGAGVVGIRPFVGILAAIPHRFLNIIDFFKNDVGLRLKESF